MSPEITIIILFMINIPCYYLGGVWVCVFSFIITFYIALSIYGIVGTPELFQSHFRGGICYIKDYTGAYNSHSEVFDYMNKLIEEKNLNDFSIIALYYDILKKDKENEKEQRCSIGLYLKNDGDEIYQVPEEIEKYLIVEEKFRKHNLVDTKSIHCSWNYFNNFNMMMGRRKFYNLIQKKLNSRRFLEAYNLKKEQLNIAIEVYENFFEEKNIYFYMPFEKSDKFFIYGKDKKE